VENLQDSFVKIILLDSILQPLKWLPLDDIWLLYNLISNISLGLIFSVFLLYYKTNIISILFFMTCFFEVIFVFSDKLFTDKYDEYFEYLHLILLFGLIYECIKYIWSSK